MAGVLNSYLKAAHKGLNLNGFELEVRLKRIKHLYFRVYPGLRKVVISAPLGISCGELLRVTASRKSWIEKQVRRRVSCDFSHAAVPAGPDDDRIWFKGRMVHIERTGSPVAKKRIELISDHLVVPLGGTGSDDNGASRITAFLREQLYDEMGRLVRKWEPRLHVEVKEYRVRKMKTRWGSCNITAKRIWLNQALIHFSPLLIEYVFVHEMVHLLERKHNARFNACMDRFIPGWRDLKKQLNRGIPKGPGEKRPS